jgi:Uma2 family endonuclease
MKVVTTSRLTIPAGPWTVDDLDDFPEGTGTRYELIDGALLVSAEPSLQHQRVSSALLRLLQDWFVEPDALALTVLELSDGAYAEVGRVRGEESFEVTRPFAIRLVPAQLAR